MNLEAVTFERVTLETLNDALPLLAAQFAEHRIPITAAELVPATQALCDGSDRGALLIARRAGAAVGVAALTFTWSLEHAGRVAWLEELYVLERERNRGIGRALLEHACAVAGAAGCRAVDLEVAEDHARAEALYRRQGFRCLGRSRWARKLLP